MRDCGLQVAAAVNACLDSGADRVVIIIVLHAFTREMEESRIRGPMRGRITALSSSDASILYHAPAPTWAAAATIEWRPS